MLLPIIHTLVSSPPPLGVTTKKELALGLFFASKDIFQMVFAPIAGILTTKTSANLMLILSTIGLGLATLVFAEATTFHQLLIARGEQGATSAAVMCGGMSLIAETHTQDVVEPWDSPSRDMPLDYYVDHLLVDCYFSILDA
jgi:MFS family permease